MKRFLLLSLLASVGALAHAGTLTVLEYDLDSTSYVYPVICTPPANATCPGDGFSDARLITTSGAASNTVTTVASNAAFDLAAVGSVITFVPSQTTTAVTRVITAKASSNSVTISGAAVTIPSTGTTFRLWNLQTGGTATDGWFDVGALISMNFIVDIAQLNVTGGIDYMLECRHVYFGGVSSAFTVVPATNKTAVSVSSSGWALSGSAQGPWDQCRVGLKIGTSDDGGDTGANAEKITVTFDGYR